METVSAESLKKALETLGLTSVTETPAAIVAESASVEKTELQKAEEAVALAQAKVEAIKNPTAQTLNKAELVEELSKASNEKFKAIATILASKDDKIEELTKAVTIVMGFNKALGERLGMIEKTPMPGKAVRMENVQVRERFEKGGEGNENGNEAGNASVPVFSISKPQHRAKVASMIMGELKKSYAAHGEKLDSEDVNLQKAISQVEIGNVSDPARDMIQERLKVRLVR